jgi:hypothetical protein
LSSQKLPQAQEGELIRLYTAPMNRMYDRNSFQCPFFLEEEGVFDFGSSVHSDSSSSHAEFKIKNFWTQNAHHHAHNCKHTARERITHLAQVH